MAKIHPNIPLTTSSLDQSSSHKETFTIWMKSLVCHSNGCTVFDTKGDVVFRVDNYQQRCSKKVFLMDSTGNILFSLQKHGMFACWEGFKWIDSRVRMEKPCFRVKRNRAILRNDASSCVVTVDGKSCYKILGFEGKSMFRVIDVSSGGVVAEAAEKESSEGVGLGSDVLRLSVEENVDQSLVMALLIVYGLINNKL